MKFLAILLLLGTAAGLGWLLLRALFAAAGCLLQMVLGMVFLLLIGGAWVAFSMLDVMFG